ncbi:MAG TPA: formate transporter FocA, partial [Thermoleophilaceae bacterium]|nr:formate transporter FocA [Thermoleophilaceae bacterium]
MTAAAAQVGADGAAPQTAPPPPGAIDAPLPPAMAARASDLGVSKADLDTTRTFLLAVLAGAFIALGAMFATVVTAGAGDVPFGVARLAAGVVFCLGLLLVVAAGAELFTGNNLIVMAWADRRVTLARLLRNWGIVYAGNLAGALATVLLVFAARQYEFGDGAVGLNALDIANTKASLGWGQAVALGILCNALVCMAIWLSYSARSLTDKFFAILLPISAFVAAGFEHSVANMYFLPVGLLVKEGAAGSFWQTTGASADDYGDLTWTAAALDNILPVTLGNVFGGSVMVGIVY